MMSWQQLFKEKQSWLQEHSMGDGPTVQTLALPTQHDVKPASTHDAPNSPFPPPPLPLPLPPPLPLPGEGTLEAAMHHRNQPTKSE